MDDNLHTATVRATWSVALDHHAVQTDEIRPSCSQPSSQGLKSVPFWSIAAVASLVVADRHRWFLTMQRFTDRLCL